MMEPGKFQHDGKVRPVGSSENGTTGADRGEHKVAAERKQISVIGADIVITGNIEASVDLHIDGKVIGDVRCATLILGESSSVMGRVYAARLKVSGTLEGVVETKDLAVEASAHVKGEITYERLRVANGGVLEGTITRRIVTDSAEQVRELHVAGEVLLLNNEEEPAEDIEKPADDIIG
jgi:cytoskeletal protein CcmA (bactofilin family)